MRVIAHDLGGPLTGINLTLQACRKLAKSPSMHKLLDSIDHDLTSATDLLEELKSLNRREIYRLQKLDLVHEMRSLVEQISATPKTPITIDFSDAGSKLAVAGDLSRLRRTWQNIIRNAMDAAEQHRTIEPVRLAISAKKTGNFARLQFSDNAGGIHKSRLPRIFEPFYTSNVEKNRGLGLFIARKIILEHNGKIRVTSRKSFTRVTIDLPLIA